MAGEPPVAKAASSSSMAGIELDAAHGGDVSVLEALAAEAALSVDFSRELARSYAVLRVARSSGIPVGFLLAWRAADELHLTDLAVTARYRRSGVGRRLVSELCERGARSGAACVLLEVRPSNVAALGLYHGLGFEELAVRSRYYADTGEDAVVMRRNLG